MHKLQLSDNIRFPRSGGMGCVMGAGLKTISCEQVAAWVFGARALGLALRDRLDVLLYDTQGQLAPTPLATHRIHLVWWRMVEHNSAGGIPPLPRTRLPKQIGLKACPSREWLTGRQAGWLANKIRVTEYQQ